MRRRRDAREAELAEMERLRDEERRLRDAEQFEDWQAKEEDFHRDQTRLRSLLRLAGGRSRPVDRLARNVLLVELGEKAIVVMVTNMGIQTMAHQGMKRWCTEASRSSVAYTSRIIGTSTL